MDETFEQGTKYSKIDDAVENARLEKRSLYQRFFRDPELRAFKESGE